MNKILRITVPVLFSILAFGASAPDAFAGTVTLVPSGIGNYDSWSLGAGSTKVSAVASNDGNTSYISETSNGDAETFVVANAALHAGAVVNSVTLNVVATSTGTASINLRVEKGTGGADRDDDSDHLLTNSYATYTRTMTSNPLTGLGWTRDEVNAWTTRFGVKYNDSGTNNSARVTQVSVTVSYTVIATLTVTKIVTNDNGGTKVVSNFPLFIDGMSVTSGVASTTSVGLHTVSETNQTGYIGTIGGDCASDGTITLAGGDNKTCTITNDDIQPKLTVTKVVVNDNGGSKVVSDFPLFVGEGSVTSGVQNSYNAGSYTISETSDSGYTGVIGGNCAADGTITLSVGDVKTCSIDNYDKTAGLTVIKSVTNDNGGTKTAGDFVLRVNGMQVTNGVATTTLSAGTHTVSEDADSGYVGTFGGDCDINGSVTLANGESKTCTITNNDKTGTLHVIKKIINDNGGTAATSTFNFSVNSGTAVSFEEDGQNDITVNAGTYSVTETATSTYATTYSYGESSNCSGINIVNGGEATCTITNNDKPAKLTIVKKTSSGSGDGTFGFTVTKDGSTEQTASPSITTHEGTGQISPTEMVQLNLSAGSYNVNEASVPEGQNWNLSGVNCVYDEHGIGESIVGGEHITVGNGDEVTCTFTNTTAPVISEQKAASPAETSITVTWTTDHNATSRVIYDTVSHSELGSAPNYGYANSTGTTDEDPMVTSHSVTVSGLASGTSYYLRTVSHGSPEAVSDEFTSTTTSATATVRKPECSDGKDNDNDGRVDYPEDGSCYDKSDDSEGGDGGGGFPSTFIFPTQGQVLGAATSTATTIINCSYSPLITKYLRRGRTNDTNEVIKLQQFLNTEMNSSLPITGFFGQLTENTVKAFQAKYASDILTPWGLTASTGVVYKSTQFKINVIRCTLLGLSIDIPFPVLQ